MFYVSRCKSRLFKNDIFHNSIVIFWMVAKEIHLIVFIGQKSFSSHKTITFGRSVYIAKVKDTLNTSTSVITIRTLAFQFCKIVVVSLSDSFWVNMDARIRDRP